MRRTPYVFLIRGKAKIAPWGIEFIFETVCEKCKCAKQKKQASNTLDEDQLEELTSWIFSRHKASEIEGIDRSNLLESPRVKSTKERELFAKYLLCDSSKNNFQLLILGFCRKFSTLVSECALSTDKENKKAAISMAWMKMLAGEFSSRKGHSRAIVNRTFPGWTAIGVTRSRSYGYMCLEKTLCYFIIILGVLGTETEGNIQTHP